MSFRTEILKEVGLDCCQYISLPQLSFDMMLKITGVTMSDMPSRSPSPSPGGAKSPTSPSSSSSSKASHLVSSSLVSRPIKEPRPTKGLWPIKGLSSPEAELNYPRSTSTTQIPSPPSTSSAPAPSPPSASTTPTPAPTLPSSTVIVRKLNSPRLGLGHDSDWLTAYGPFA